MVVLMARLAGVATVAATIAGLAAGERQQPPPSKSAV